MSVSGYISEFDGPQREVLDYFNHLLLELGLESKIRFKIPFYYGHSWVVYLNPVKDGGIELAFLRANELSNHLGLLDFKKRKQVAGITYYSTKEIQKEEINEVIHEALILDETVKYTVRKSKKGQ